MKHKFLIVLIFLAFSCMGQKDKAIELTYENFDNEILKYEPIKKSGVSEKDHKHGIFLLDETKKVIDNNPDNLTYADYWNITMAFINFDESSNNIEIAFKKAIELDPVKVCTIIKSFGNSELDIRIPESFYAFVNNCSDNKEIEIFDSESYSKKNSLDPKLVSLIYEINLKDIKYRFDKPVDWSKQRPLDEQNQKLIDSLNTKYNTYIGKSLVGEKFETVMWAVIQHSNMATMEKYLPIMQRAVSEKELDAGPFKMLIDRYYGLKYGYQIFGSQSGFGFDLADEKKKKEIEIKYGIE
jgi:hypothetical protein